VSHCVQLVISVSVHTNGEAREGLVYFATKCGTANRIKLMYGENAAAEQYVPSEILDWMPSD
jgi:hypothetical protein